MSYATERDDTIDVVAKGLMEDTFNPQTYPMFMEAIREDALYNNVDIETLQDAIESGNYEALGKEITRGVYNYCYARANSLAASRFDDRDRTRDSGSNYLRANYDNF